MPLTTVNSWSTGTSLPRDLDQLVAVGAVLARWAGERPPAGREWEKLLRADKAARGSSGKSGRAIAALGRPIGELADPFALEVHRPVAVDSAADLPLLSPYIRRPHDGELAEVAARAASGRSGMAVLVGGSKVDGRSISRRQIRTDRDPAALPAGAHRDRLAGRPRRGPATAKPRGQARR